MYLFNIFHDTNIIYIFIFLGDCRALPNAKRSRHRAIRGFRPASVRIIQPAHYIHPRVSSVLRQGQPPNVGSTTIPIAIAEVLT